MRGDGAFYRRGDGAFYRRAVTVRFKDTEIFRRPRRPGSGMRLAHARALRLPKETRLRAGLVPKTASEVVVTVRFKDIEIGIAGLGLARLPRRSLVAQAVRAPSPAPAVVRGAFAVSFADDGRPARTRCASDTRGDGAF